MTLMSRPETGADQGRRLTAMEQQIRSAGIIWNPEKEENGRIAEQISGYLKERGADCFISRDGRDLPDGISCVIVLGGDGSLLRAAKLVLNRQLPLLGINLGALGYLAEVEVSGMYQALDRLLAGEYSVEKRMMLEGTVYRGGKEVLTDVALNDIVINRRKALRNYRIVNFVNGKHLNAYSADGEIIATATGSTAYSLSVGGPIVSPAAELLLMTPVAPHSLNKRSIIFSPSDVIRILIGEGRTGFTEDVVAVRFDGGADVPLSTGDSVEIRRYGLYTGIIRISHLNFLDVLRRKMADA